jgi:Squalene-hopene cyclase C-terminal domain
MWTRRQFLTRSGLGMLGTAGTCFAVSGDNRGDGGPEGAIPDGSASKGMITPETDQAIEKGLEYLSRHPHMLRPHHGSFGTNGYEGNVAITSVAALAFMAAGNQPNRGPYGRVVTDALKFVLRMERGDGKTPGFLYNRDATPHGPMYGHGFGTLFLAEVSGMVHDKALREEVNLKLHRAVEVIINGQNREGGWRYFPRPNDADISVTVCQVMALRAARNAGVAVPKKVIDDCVAYVKRCQDKMQGWFRYQANGNGAGGPQAVARTAAGVAALYSAGIYSGDEIEKGLKFLESHAPGRGNTFGRLDRPDMHYYYGHYYAVQAMWTAGGDRWKKWYPAIRDELLANQRQDGGWPDGICSHYGTAMACLILQIPNNYLPILQK